MAMQSSYPFFYLPSQSSSSDSESSITTVDDNFISNHNVIDLVLLENECNNNTIGSSIESPSPIYRSGYCTQRW